MVEMIIGTYGLLCWLLFKKFKLIPVTTYTVCTAILGGIVILVGLYIALSVFHPVAHDGRLYGPAVQILPNVRGLVIEVPVEANKPVRQGDVLFRIDPKPFQIEVDRLKALLASKNQKFSQLSEDLAAAEAATKQAKANLMVAESEFDRQARENHEQAVARLDQVRVRRDLAKTQFDRTAGLHKTGTASQQEFDRDQSRLLSAEEEYRQADSAEKVAKEKLASGSGSLEAARQDIARLQAAERNIRIQLQTDSAGVSPDVRETMAQLDKARWDLDQTVVRAPANGYVPQVLLRPGQMAVPVPLKPLMVFIVGEKPVLVASFQQKVISEFKPGLQAEVVFKAYPGRTFKVKVRRVLEAIHEGEFTASGQLVSTTDAHEPGYIPVVFDYEDDVAALNLPLGAQGSVAVYTERVHALSIVRKIILRIKSWENYLF